MAEADLSKGFGPDTRTRFSRRRVLQLAGASAAAAGLGSLLAACGGNGPGSGSGPKAPGALPEMTPFHVQSAKIDSYFIDAVNLTENHYADYNLEVSDFIYPTSGLQGMQLMAAGQVDGGMTDTLVTLATFANSAPGTRPVVVGMRLNTSPYALVVNKEGSWPDANAGFEERMKSLKGKTVGLTAIGAGADQVLRLALARAGMQYSDVTPLAVGQTTPGIAQMQAGKLDAYVAQAWTMGRFVAQRTGGKVLIDFGANDVPDVLSKQQVGSIVVREDHAEQHQDAVKAWLACQSAALQWITKNKDEAAGLLNTQMLGGQSPDIAKDYVDHFTNTLVPQFQPDFKVTKDGVERMIGIAVQNGTVKEGQIKYEDLVPDFARA
ncbi:ABC transporter substrate-binding protein [Saccharopolyspora sp. NPDC050389]|uniref:ABC transporter substrate-binding protein n=1 Tax=Saccharopolyspora sp. NPDC050389 TaxID=3155516 RepID=UPI003402BCB2